MPQMLNRNLTIPAYLVNQTANMRLQLTKYLRVVFSSFHQAR